VISHLIVSYRSKYRKSQFSTGNKGVGQLVINFFSKCGIPLILFPLILALLCMTGCLEQSPEISVTPSLPQDQPADPGMQMDFDVELHSDLFDLRGNIMLPGNSSLAYLMLNATLRQEGKEKFNTKYLLMQIDPNRDYRFEITKNVKIPVGEYDCTLKAEGPQGVLAEENRKVSLEQSGQELLFEQIPWPVELEETVSAQEEFRPREESTVQKVISNDGRSADQKSSTLPKENGTFMGSITSKKYHRPDCRYALKIKPDNRIYFPSIEDANSQGYLSCKVCNP